MSGRQNLTSIMVHCPCCSQPWRVQPHRRLPLFALKRLAFRYVKQNTGVDAALLSSASQKSEVVHARALFVWIVKTFGPANLSYPTIARWIDKNHTSIMNQWSEIVPRLRDTDADFAALCGGFAEFALQEREPLQ